MQTSIEVLLVLIEYKALIPGIIEAMIEHNPNTLGKI
jgi:hypothetical protein